MTYGGGVGAVGEAVGATLAKAPPTSRAASQSIPCKKKFSIQQQANKRHQRHFIVGNQQKQTKIRCWGVVGKKVGIKSVDERESNKILMIFFVLLFRLIFFLSANFIPVL